MPIPDSLLSNRPIGNLNAAAMMYLAHFTTRVAHVVYGNSNGLYLDNGFVRALGQGLGSRFQCHSFGVMSPCQSVDTDYGGGFEMRRRADSGITTTQKTLSSVNVFNITGATYTDATKTITKTGAFTNLSLVAGHSFVRSPSGTGVTNTADNLIVSKTNDTIVLTTSLGAGADGQTNIACTAIRPPAFAYDAWNIPTNQFSLWKPHDTGLYYVAPSTNNWTNAACFLVEKRQAPLPVNGRLVYDLMWLEFASGTGSFQPRFTHSDGASTDASSTAGTSVTTTAGSAGTIHWATDNAIKSYATRASTTGTQYLNCGLGNITNTGSLALGFANLYNYDATYGYSVQAMACQGGMSRHRITRLITSEMSDTSLVTYYRAVCRQFSTTAGGSGSGVIVVHVMDSFNTAGTGNDVDGVAKNASSLGPSPAASNTAAGYTDNAKAIKTELDAIIATAAAAEGVTATIYYVLHTEWCVSDAPTSNPSVYTAAEDVQGWQELYFASDAAWAVTTTNVIANFMSRYATCYQIVNQGLLSEDAASTRTAPASTASRHLNSAGYNRMVTGFWDSITQAIGSAASQNLIIYTTSGVSAAPQRVISRGPRGELV